MSSGGAIEDEYAPSVSPFLHAASLASASPKKLKNHHSRLLAIVVLCCGGFAPRGAAAFAPPVTWPRPRPSRHRSVSSTTLPGGVVGPGPRPRRDARGALFRSTATSSSARRLFRPGGRWGGPRRARRRVRGAPRAAAAAGGAGGGGFGGPFGEDPFDDLARGESGSDGDGDGEEDDVPDDFDAEAGGAVFYDDFGDYSVGGGGGLIGEGSEDDEGVSASGGGGALDLEALTSRVNEQRAESVRRDARLARNWSSGNWAVRGFALDAFDAAEDLGRPSSEEEGTGRRMIGGSTAAEGERSGGGTRSPGDPEEDVTLPSSGPTRQRPEESSRSSSPSPRGRIHVSRIALDLESVDLPGGGSSEYDEAGDDRDAVLAVGRTDGSCVVVRLGGEYLTRFRSVPELTFEEVEPEVDEAENGRTDDGGGGEVDDPSSSASSVVARVGSRLVRSDDLREAGPAMGKSDADDPVMERSRTAAAGSASTNDNNRPYNDEEERGGAPPTPFEILHQFQAIRRPPPSPPPRIEEDYEEDADYADSDVAVTSLLLDGEDLFASGGGSGRVEHWRLPPPGDGGAGTDDDVVVVPKVEHVRTLAVETAADDDEIVAIRALASPSSAEDDDGEEEEERNLILTVARGGTFSLWDRRATGGGDDEPIATVVVRDERNETVSGILSADVVTMPSPADADADGGGVDDYEGGGGRRTLIFLGLETGHVQGYALRDVLDSCGSSRRGPGGSMMAGDDAAADDSMVVVPSCRFLAHGDAGAPGVTALAWAGAGTLAPSRGSPSSSRGSSILLTGGADGVVKQWEIFARGGGGGDDPSGTPVRLEYWPRLSTQRMRRRAHVLTGTRHDGGVTAVAGDAAKVLSCGADGRVVAWSPSTGERMYSMDGFTGGISSLCVGRTLLVTDGMDGYVCLHDFDTGESLDDAYDTEVD